MNELDYRFSLANERTYLAWLRTAVALIAAGLLAAKALDFEHEAWRLAVSLPPIVGGALMAVRSRIRFRDYDQAMRAGKPLPPSADAATLAVALSVYAAVVLAATLVDS